MAMPRFLNANHVRSVPTYKTISMATMSMARTRRLGRRTTACWISPAVVELTGGDSRRSHKNNADKIAAGNPTKAAKNLSKATHKGIDSTLIAFV
jgi:hypothetical protein